MKYTLILALFLLGCTKEEPILLRSSPDLIFNPSPTCIWDEVTVTFDNGLGNNCGWSKIEILIDDQWIVLAQRNPVDGLIHARYVPSSTGNFQFKASWTKRGGCQGGNVKISEVLEVTNSCCQNYFLSESICIPEICEYGIKFELMVDVDCYAILTCTLPLYVDLCGFYDENNNLVLGMSGNQFIIEGDLYGCQTNHFFVYMNTPIPPPSVWELRYPAGTLTTSPNPCIIDN